MLVHNPSPPSGDAGGDNGLGQDGDNADYVGVSIDMIDPGQIVLLDVPDFSESAATFAVQENFSGDVRFGVFMDEQTNVGTVYEVILEDVSVSIGDTLTINWSELKSDMWDEENSTPISGNPDLNYLMAVGVEVTPDVGDGYTMIYAASKYNDDYSAMNNIELEQAIKELI